MGPLRASSTDIYEAVVALSRTIAGRTDLRSLLSGVAESLRRIVRFDHLGLILHDPDSNSMQGHILNAPGNPVITTLQLPVDEDPAGWVWLESATTGGFTCPVRDALAGVRITLSRVRDQYVDPRPLSLQVITGLGRLGSAP